MHNLGSPGTEVMPFASRLAPTLECDSLWETAATSVELARLGMHLQMLVGRFKV